MDHYRIDAALFLLNDKQLERDKLAQISAAGYRLPLSSCLVDQKSKGAEGQDGLARLGRFAVEAPKQNSRNNQMDFTIANVRTPQSKMTSVHWRLILVKLAT